MRGEGAHVTRVAVLGHGAGRSADRLRVRARRLRGAVGQDGAGAQQRVEEALRLASTSGLAGPAELERARSLMVRGDATISSVGAADADHRREQRGRARRGAAEARRSDRADRRAPPGGARREHRPVPSVTALGEAAGVGERMLATRYGDPPLLCPVVELLAARDTPHRLLERVSQLLRALGKHPLVLRREVPGLASGRLELALLREALWLLERGVVEPEELDELVRDSLARRWALIGPLAARRARGAGRAARAGRRRAQRAALPATRTALPSLAAEAEPDRLAALRERRDAGMSEALRAERASAPARARTALSARADEGARAAGSRARRKGPANGGASRRAVFAVLQCAGPACDPQGCRGDRSRARGPCGSEKGTHCQSSVWARSGGSRSAVPRPPWSHARASAARRCGWSPRRPASAPACSTTTSRTAWRC